MKGWCSPCLPLMQELAAIGGVAPARPGVAPRPQWGRLLMLGEGVQRAGGWLLPREGCGAQSALCKHNSSCCKLFPVRKLG